MLRETVLFYDGSDKKVGIIKDKIRAGGVVKIDEVETIMAIDYYVIQNLDNVEFSFVPCTSVIGIYIKSVE